MTLIPFILDLADELNEFNRSLATATGMDVDDFGFGIYPGEQHHYSSSSLQPPQISSLSPPRRTRLAAPLYWVPGSLRQRHHPYQRGVTKTACCNKSVLELEKELAEKESAPASSGAGTSGVSAAKSAYSVVNKNGFQVSMNVKQFASDELTVKTIDNCIVVEGQHDEKEDGHGVISRHFIRKYMLPKGYDPNQVLSTLSSDGILTVKAPPPPPPTVKATEDRLERLVDIQQTGGPAQLPLAKDAQTPPKEQQQSSLMSTKSTTATTTTTAAAAAAAPAAAAAAPAVVGEKDQQPKAAAAAAAVAASSTVDAVQQKSAAHSEERNTDGAIVPAEIATNAKDSLSQALEISNNVTAAATQQEQPEPMLLEVSASDGAALAVVAIAKDEDTVTAATAAPAPAAPAAAAATVTQSAEPTVEAVEATKTFATNAAANNDDKNVNIKNGSNASDVATEAVSATEDVEMSGSDTTTNTASIGHVDGVQDLVAATAAASPKPKTGELLAAADAAILLAKAQCENGDSVNSIPATASTEEVAN